MLTGTIHRRITQLRIPRINLKKTTAVSASTLLIATLVLPAYANASPAGYDYQRSPSPAADTSQHIEVPAEAATIKVSRDSYAALTGLQVRQEAADSAHAARLAALKSLGVEPGDDYPWPHALTDDEGGGLSPIGYYYRECVDFVAWRLNQDAGATSNKLRWRWSDLTPQGGDASQWKANWEAHHWPVSADPQPGWVAWWGSNHVAYVESVNLADKTVHIEEYNLGNQGRYSSRTIPIAHVDAFLSPPPA
ncbi:CHAP domain-containing protein [Leifsonia sp. Leaf264]|uniref:CHAP domain-containing protein n=1 Tax=Leifsonia sp. Leaf264 TaxID=1736314 RepID=UPI0006F7766A|nr:CHAP domain-containing protein [Leifsonia sp. Leaf264]KQO98906.1 hypothetical protein ASF30_12655 [Leifsonia sp. Leaf264]